jgi:DNA-binding CsgD family transcriptional regulator
MGAFEESLAALRRLGDEAAASDDAMRLTRVQVNVAVVLENLGRYEEAAEAARAGFEAASRAGLARTLGSHLRLCLASALAAMGRWDEAVAAADAGLALDPRARAGAVMYAIRGEVALARGDADTARAQLSLARTLLGPATDVDAETLPVSRLEAELALLDGRIDDARDAVAKGLRVVVERGLTADSWRLLTAGARVEAHGRLRARVFREEAEAGPLEQLRAVAKAVATDTPLASACAAQFRAEIGDEPGSWADVAVAWDRLGDPYRACSALVRAGEWAAARGDRAAARAWLGRAADQSERLGALALLGDIRALGCGAGEDAEPEPSAVTRLGLTGRELEVLRLMAAGRTNRQIAERLFISPKTASVHVSRILHKLGAANRVEAAATAYRLRLGD